MHTKASIHANTASVADFVDKHGYAVIERVVDPDELDDLVGALEDVRTGEAVRRRASVYAIRNLLDEVPAVRSISESPAFRRYVDAVLGSSAIAVRGILFDKTGDANWTVPWHQDLAIAVRKRIEVEGFGAWSMKAGVPHVQPPSEILERMLGLRLHLDDCDADNGPLDVLPGSHRHGRLTDGEVDRWKSGTDPVTCTVARGGIILMRPLLLHRSLSAASPRRRRVIHIEYASAALPDGLEWYHQAR